MINHTSTYNKKTAYILSFCLILFFGLPGIAQDITTKAVLEKNKALIGDQVKMSISVIKPKDTEVIFPEFVQNLTDTIEVIKQFKPDTSILEDGNMLIEKNVLITAFDSGSYIIAPIPILIKNENRFDTIYTNALAFNVNTVPLDTTNIIKDIKLPYGAPVTFREALPYIIISLGAILIILLIVYIIIKLKRKEPIFRRFRPLEPAHIIAFRDLEKLKNEKLWQNGKIKDYYTRITDILRHYLWHRYAIRTMERTSDEILQSLKASEFDDDKLFTILKDIFFTSDLVKFAKFNPQTDEHEKCFEGAFQFVDNTKLIIIDDSEETEKSANDIYENKSVEVKPETNEKIDQ